MLNGIGGKYMYVQHCLGHSGFCNVNGFDTTEMIRSIQWKVFHLSNKLHISVFFYLQNYPLEEVLSGAYLWKKYDPDVIQKLMDKLVPENMM